MSGTVLADALVAQQDRLGHCVHCGFCLPVCPTYIQLGDEADSPRGRLHLMQAVVEGRLDPASDAYQTHMDRCLGCRACESVCPSGVEYGFLLERARAVGIAARRPSGLARLLPAVMERRRMRAFVLAAGRALRATGLPGVLARRLPASGRSGPARLGMGMLGASRPVPPLRWGERAEIGDESGSGQESPAPPTVPDEGRRPAAGSRGRVALLTGCVQGGLFGHVNEATRLVLRVNGWDPVEVPAQGCCGALHAHAGDLEGARRLARSNLEAFHAAGVDHVISNAAGCGALLREVDELLGDPEAAPFAASVRDITELLAGESDAPVVGGALPLRVAYDPPCHLHHAQRVTEAPLRLLRSIPGIELVPVPHAEECCGGAGIYGVTHPDLGGRVGSRKVESILSTACDVVATGNPGCQMQIGAGLTARDHDIPVLHPVELLAESYRRAGWT